MPDMTEEAKAKKVGNRRVHMANERTFLAWIRTSIGLMAFGFVVEKFALFVRQMSYFLQKSTVDGGIVKGADKLVAPPSSYSASLGIFLVGLGALMGVLSFIRYKKVERQIDDDAFVPSALLDIMLMLAVMSVGVFLVVYLVHSL